MLNNYRISQKLQCNGIKQELWERYGPQLTLYKEAMTRVMNNEVNDTVLYSFYMNAPVYAPGKE